MKKALVGAATLIAGMTSLTATAQDLGEERDVTASAQNQGISVAEARRQANLDRQAAQIEEKLSNNPHFVGLQIVRAGATYRVKASFTKGGRPARAGLGSSTELDAVTDFADGRFSKGDQAKTIAAVRSRLAPTNINYKAAVDQDSGVFVVEVDDVAAAAAALSDLGEEVSVVDTAFSGTGFSNVVKVSKSAQGNIAMSGDSGGPVFSWNATNSMVQPLGIVKGANPSSPGVACKNTSTIAANNTACYFTVMPLKIIRGYQPFTINTVSGFVAP